MTEFQLAQMKKAIREALPAGAGDFTVTAVAKAAIAIAEEWIREAERDAYADANLEARERE